MNQMKLLPAAPGTCDMCAVDHPPDQPHNRDSLFYLMRFRMTHGRSPTWADASAHCRPGVIAAWKASVEERKPGTWTETDDPIAEPPNTETEKETQVKTRHDIEPTWAKSYDRENKAWPKYLAATTGSAAERTRKEWLLYREGYAQGQKDAAEGVSNYPGDTLSSQLDQLAIKVESIDREYDKQIEYLKRAMDESMRTSPRSTEIHKISTKHFRELVAGNELKIPIDEPCEFYITLGFGLEDLCAAQVAIGEEILAAIKARCYPANTFDTDLRVD